MKWFLLALALFLLSSGCTDVPDAGSVSTMAAEPIRPYSENPRYWEYEGEPIFLVGGSKDDNLFQIPDLEAHLDQLADAGGNYVRNTMSSRDSGNVWPFYRLDDGTYDLERLNDTYFDSFEQLLRLAAERDIIVQIELWDRFDFAREPWLNNPYRPANNINYTTEESGMENEYPRHPGQNDNPFFRSIPAHDNNQYILPYQQAQVDRMLDIAFQYPNVLFVMDNETSATPEWGAYWSEYITEKAAAAGVEIYTTEMWDAWDLKDEQHRRTLDHPERYAFADISQNNHNTDQEHWDNLQWARSYTSASPRPLNNVKIYGADTGPYGTDRDGIERFWRNIIGGAASVRFHRPPSGLGLSDSALTHIRSARMLLSAIDIFRAVPDSSSSLLFERDDDEAYLTYIPNEAYVLYFPDGGSVSLDLGELAGRFLVRWLDIENSQWQDGEVVESGQNVRLDAPGSGHWAAVIRK